MAVIPVIVGDEEASLYTPKLFIPPEPEALTFVMMGEDETFIMPKLFVAPEAVAVTSLKMADELEL